jgi:uncharacterized SAM-binding protein YcdF (DUF218 family)
MLVECLHPLPFGFLAGGLIWLLAWRTHHSWRRTLAWLAAPWILVGLSITPAVTYFACGALEWWYVPLAECPAEVEAIVVLGGGHVPVQPWSAEPALAPDSAVRSREAARLYRAGEPRLVVVCGGPVRTSVDSSTTLAELMAQLLTELQVAPADILQEQASRDTYENATQAARLLHARQVKRVVLVTDALHMARAVRCFQNAGLEVVPAPCDYRTARFTGRPSQFLPQASGAEDAQRLAHEILGFVWFQARGKI